MFMLGRVRLCVDAWLCVCFCLDAWLCFFVLMPGCGSLCVCMFMFVFIFLFVSVLVCLILEPRDGWW